MEVHHHSHSSRQKWTHYLWEFIMLFLAVFCGFLAENKREHMVEHHKARTYARSLLKDLQSDTLEIKNAFLYEDHTVAMIDSLLSLTQEPKRLVKGGELYYYIRMATWMYTVDWSKATLDQLISSGNLRFFTNSELVALISEYNTLSHTILDLQQSIEASRGRAVGYRDQLVKASVAQKYFIVNMEDLIKGRVPSYLDSLKKQDFPLQSTNPDLMNSFVNALLGTKTNRQLLKRRDYPQVIKKAGEIMKLLKEEYDLE